MNINGFDTGILVTNYLHSIFAHIKLSGQRDVAFVNRGHNISVYDLHVDCPKAQRVEPLKAVTPYSASHPQRRRQQQSCQTIKRPVKKANNTTVACFRNVTTTGEQSMSGIDAEIASQSTIEQFVHPQVHTLSSKQKLSLDLTVPETPWPSFPQKGSDWTVVHAPTEGDKKGDITENLQAAIDNGAEYIWFTFGKITDTIRIHGNTKIIAASPNGFKSAGFQKTKITENTPHGKVIKPVNQRPIWRIEEGSNKSVMLAFLLDNYGSAGWSIDNATVVMSLPLIAVVSYRNKEGGRLVYDCLSAGSHPRRPRAVCLARQLRDYAHHPNVLNDGAKLWVLHTKTEKDRTIFECINGSRTELLGASFSKTASISMVPATVVRDSTSQLLRDPLTYDTLVEEHMNGKKRSSQTPVAGMCHCTMKASIAWFMCPD